MRRLCAPCARLFETCGESIIEKQPWRRDDPRWPELEMVPLVKDSAFLVPRVDEENHPFDKNTGRVIKDIVAHVKADDSEVISLETLRNMAEEAERNGDSVVWVLTTPDKLPREGYREVRTIRLYQKSSIQSLENQGDLVVHDPSMPGTAFGSGEIRRALLPEQATCPDIRTPKKKRVMLGWILSRDTPVDTRPREIFVDKTKFVQQIRSMFGISGGAFDGTQELKAVSVDFFVPVDGITADPPHIEAGTDTVKTQVLDQVRGEPDMTLDLAGRWNLRDGRNRNEMDEAVAEKRAKHVLLVRDVMTNVRIIDTPEEIDEIVEEIWGGGFTGIIQDV